MEKLLEVALAKLPEAERGEPLDAVIQPDVIGEDYLFFLIDNGIKGTKKYSFSVEELVAELVAEKAKAKAQAKAKAKAKAQAKAKAEAEAEKEVEAASPKEVEASPPTPKASPKKATKKTKE